MFLKNNFYFKVTHYFIDQNQIFPFFLKNANIKYKSLIKDTARQVFTGYQVQTPYLYLILPFLNKNGNYYFSFK